MSSSFLQMYSMKDIAFKTKLVLSWAEDNDLQDDCNRFSMFVPVFEQSHRIFSATWNFYKFFCQKESCQISDNTPRDQIDKLV